MKPYPGLMVLYRWRPGQVRAGETDAAAVVTKVYPDETVDLTIFVPSMGPEIHQNRVMHMSKEVPCHCWHMAPAANAGKAEVPQHIADDLDALRIRVAKLEYALSERQKKPAA